MDELKLIELAQKARAAIKEAEKKYEEAEGIYREKLAAYLKQEEGSLDYEKLVDMGKRLAQ